MPGSSGLLHDRMDVCRVGIEYKCLLDTMFGVSTEAIILIDYFVNDKCSLLYP